MTSTSIRLLLLEDNAGDARLVQEALAEHAPDGFVVVWVERLAQALSKLAAEQFDIVLCDLGLPDSSGLATAHKLSTCAPAPALVVLTGSHDENLGREAIQHGAQDYLVKGEAGGQVIVRTLRYAIERKRLEIGLRDANDALERRVAERTAALNAATATARAAEEKFRSLVEQSIAGIYVLQDAKIAYVNPRFAQIMGYDSADELIGLDPLSLVIEKDRAAVAATLRGRIDGSVPGGAYGFTGRRKDGSLIEVGLDSTRAIHDGRPAVIGLMQDISEKKRDEERIERYLAQLKSAFMRTVEMATLLSEMRDPYTAGHERRVAKLAVAIGAELGLDADRQEGLQVAGLLHDVGKIGIPAEILSKPARLSRVEFLLIQGHAEQGYEVLKDIDFPWPVAEVARQHHERMDGSGYPRGLAGDAILLEARILAVADVVEAMSSHRPYRPALGIEAALAEISRGRGSVYDAAVADTCLGLFRNKGYALANAA
jgi:PAS domain S-box-containing protein/putative nucleotidyltransferase with HDIG domain